MRAKLSKYLNTFRKIRALLRRPQLTSTVSKPATEVDAEHAVAVQSDSWADLTVGWNSNGIAPHNIAEARRRVNAVGSGPDTAE